MDFFDVVFPLNIGPLTYRRPAGYEKPIVPGTPVKAEVKKTLQYGIVLREAQGVPEGRLKEIDEVLQDSPLYNRALLSLISWMADYYITVEGVVLKSMLPKEIFEREGRVRPGVADLDGAQTPFETEPADSGIVKSVTESVSRRQYRTYLLHTPTVRQEVSFLQEIIRGAGNVIILVPEISFLKRIEGVVLEIAGERLAVSHGQLSRSARRRNLKKIVSGESDIVLGTRPAVFAPLKTVSLVVVLQEHNRSYKNLEGLRYHARDVAVMRGYLEKAPVVLSTPTPSVESFHNTVKGKYALLRPEVSVRRPRIEVVNMKTAKKEAPYLSKRSLQAAASYVNRGGNVLFFINRKGYSLIQCADCSEIPSCPGCGIPLIFHKSRMVLKCHYCGHTAGVPQSCPKCRSARLELVGAGTQRIASDIRKHLALEPLRYDADSLRDNPSLKALSDDIQGDRLIVGTKAFAGRLRAGEAYDLCVFLNPDAGLHLPDFRSAEALFQDIFGTSEFINAEGAIILQTRMPESSVYKYAKAYRINEFLTDELAVRKSLMYPPFSRMIGITISAGSDMGRALSDALALRDRDVETMGPLAVPIKNGRQWKIVLKSPAKEKVTRYAKRLLESLKDRKGVRAVVDVDPISL